MIRISEQGHDIRTINTNNVNIEKVDYKYHLNETWGISVLYTFHDSTLSALKREVLKAVCGTVKTRT